MTSSDIEDGVVVRYDADRGFGFVRSRSHGDEDVFVHATSVEGRAILHPGQRVRFRAESSDKGPRAVHVWPGRRGLSPAMASVVGLSIVLVAATAALVYYRNLPIAWAWLAAINPATFLIYGFDKHRAQAGGRRVPEAVLLGLALIGGTIGAIAAMRVFRHKTRKLAFLVPFGVVVLTQVAALTWWMAGRRAGPF